MSVTVSIPMPLISKVKAVLRDTLKVEVTWQAGLRPCRKEIVDLSPLIHSFSIFRPLRSNWNLFKTVRVVEDGDAIGWGDNEDLQISATSIERLADESMTAYEFRRFIDKHQLTHAAAAAILGYKRRQIESYLNGDAEIPRVVGLACYGYEARTQRATLGTPLSGGSHGNIGVHPALTQTRKSEAPIEFKIDGKIQIEGASLVPAE